MTEFNPFQKKAGGLGNIKDAPIQKSQSPQKSSILTQLKIKPSIIVIIIAVLGLGGYFIYHLLQTNKTAQKDTGEKVDSRVTLMKNESVLFLNHYLNLNYSVFKEERSAAEAFMTPELLSEYKENFYDNAFVQSALVNEFATDFYYNQIIPTTYTDSENVGWPAIKIIGLAKYTSTIEYFSLEMPFTILLVFTKDAEGNYKKIDNIKFE